MRSGGEVYWFRWSAQLGTDALRQSMSAPADDSICHESAAVLTQELEGGSVVRIRFCTASLSDSCAHSNIRSEGYSTAS